MNLTASEPFRFSSDEIRERVARNVRNELDQYGVTNEELAELLQIDEPMIHGLVRGEVPFTLEHLVHIWTAYPVDPSALLNLDG